MANTKAILFLLCLFPMLVIAQQLNNALSSPPHLLPATYNIKGDSLILPFKAYYNEGDSAVYYFLFITGICKGNYYSKHIFKLQSLPVEVRQVISKDSVSLHAMPAVHGDVSYGFFYRSDIDTSYADNNIIQHNARANIYTTISKTLPVAIHINARHSNSRLFKNYIDAGIEFDGQAWESVLREKLKTAMVDQIRQNNVDSLMYAGLQNKYALQHQIGQWLQDGRQIQQLMDSRQSVAAIIGYPDISGYSEKALEENVKRYLQDTIQNSEERADHTKWMRSGAALSGNIKRITALKSKGASSIATAVLSSKQEEAIAYIKEYITKREKYKQVSEEVQQWEEKYKKAKTFTRQAMDSVRQLVDATNDPAVLQSQVKNYGLDSNSSYRRVKQLMAIKKFSIGRSSVDYSELSAKNISVTGVNAEYNNRFYYAVAAGTVDYRYRDFIANRSRGPKQWLTLVRAGIGKKDGNSLILTAYRGSKPAPGFASNNVPLQNPVLGLTIEGRYSLNRNNYIIAEIAKSSYPKFAPLQNLPAGRQSGNSRTAKVSSFSDRSNEAYSIQLFSGIPSINTRIYAQYKRMGLNFQSFNIFNYNAQYSVWELKADQYFFKSALFVTASIKNNEYNSPYTIYNYKSNTIFKNIRATLRLKKWPVISAGYMPSSQLSKVGNEIIETRFNMIMATASYLYRVKQYYMHVSAMYTKFFNEASQQNFLYYNASTWMFNHNITGRRFTLSTMLSLSYSPDYNLVTADEGIQYSVSKWLKAGGGLKLNRMNGQASKLGYYGNAQLQLNKPGAVSISFDRGFLPGMSQTLLPNDMFRILYFKTF